ncbi:baseplate J/gp47 family protein [Chromobacterium alkanivorans]|uniref:baseplate assembly protein n=1 Tax=Chromobacterium alkanivorans TaxID=1071719 RepID=UPI001967A458|nr:baseplate J/gp47 family protein [Chromobacterium alkanivorans]MBN3005583.1 baseplate J/gp47 family protein [Chromobacterium alkanivorans]
MTIDITLLPAPAVVEEIDYEALLLTRKQRLIAVVPADIRDAIAATLELETEPLTILLQENAYTELILRQRINEAAKATMLAYAEKTDLDNKAADYNVTRLLVTPADPDANPPVEAVWESDDRLRLRTQMAMEGTTVAGSRGAYLFHTLSASANVADAYIDSRAFGPQREDSPAPGEVRVWLLDARGDGVPDQALLDTVTAALSAETVRPLNDTVTAAAGTPAPFAVSALLEFEEGGEALSGGLDAARTRLDALLAKAKKLGTGQKPSGLPTSALIAALKVAGVHDVTLLSPLTTIAQGVGEFPLCTAITLDKA